MGLDISPANFSGLAALAGGGGGNLNLPNNAGAMGLQALQLQMAQEEARKNQQLKLLQLQQQAQTQDYGTLAASGQGSGGYSRAMPDISQLKQQLAALNQGQQQQDVSGQQPQADPRQQAMDALKKQMTKLLDEDDESVAEKAAFATYANDVMKKATTPEEAQAIRKEILSIARDKKYMNYDEIEYASKLPLSRFSAELQIKAMQYEMVKGAKGKYSKKSEEEDSADPNVSDLTKTTTDKMQEDLIQSDDNIRQLKELVENVPDNYFGAAALGQDITAGKAWLGSVPGIGKYLDASPKDKEDLKKFGKFHSKAESLSLQIIKQLSGLAYTDDQLEYLKSILPTIGKGTTRPTFDGRSTALFEWFDGIKAKRQELLAKGITLESKPEEYKAAMKNFIIPATKTEEESDAPSTQVSSSGEVTAEKMRKHLKAKNKYSDEEIETYIKSKFK